VTDTEHGATSSSNEEEDNTLKKKGYSLFCYYFTHLIDYQIYFAASPLGPLSTTLQQLDVIITPNPICNAITIANSAEFDFRPVASPSDAASKFCATGDDPSTQDSCVVSDIAMIKYAEQLQKRTHLRIAQQ